MIRTSTLLHVLWAVSSFGQLFTPREAEKLGVLLLWWPGSKMAPMAVSFQLLRRGRVSVILESMSSFAPVDSEPGEGRMPPPFAHLRISRTYQGPRCRGDVQ